MFTAAIPNDMNDQKKTTTTKQNKTKTHSVGLPLEDTSFKYSTAVQYNLCAVFEDGIATVLEGKCI